jgi:hypothetical protein
MPSESSSAVPRRIGIITNGLHGSLRFGGEVAVAQYSGRWGLGAVVGSVRLNSVASSVTLDLGAPSK